jgi:hypothetical protein
LNTRYCKRVSIDRRQLLVERQLDAFLPLILDAIETHHVSHHVAVRVVAAGLGLLVHAGHAQLFDLVGHVHGDLALQVDEVLVLVDQAVTQVGQRRFQQLRQRVHLRRGSLLGVFRNRPDGARRHAGGQHRAVAIHDLAARRGQGQRALIAPLALLLQEFGGQPLQEQSAAGQHGEPAEQQDQHQARAPGGQLPAQHGVIEERDAFHCAPPVAEAGGWFKYSVRSGTMEIIFRPSRAMASTRALRASSARSSCRRRQLVSRSRACA